MVSVAQNKFGGKKKWSREREVTKWHFILIHEGEYISISFKIPCWNASNEEGTKLDNTEKLLGQVCYEEEDDKPGNLPTTSLNLWAVRRRQALQGALTCCDPSPFTMCGIMATSPFSNGGSSSGIWSVIIIVTYIHGEFSSTGFLQEKHRLETLQNPPVLSWISPLRRQPEQDTSCG